MRRHVAYILIAVFCGCTFVEYRLTGLNEDLKRVMRNQDQLVEMYQHVEPFYGMYPD